MPDHDDNSFGPAKGYGIKESLLNKPMATPPQAQKARGKEAPVSKEGKEHIKNMEGQQQSNESAPGSPAESTVDLDSELMPPPPPPPKERPCKRCREDFKWDAAKCEKFCHLYGASDRYGYSLYQRVGDTILALRRAGTYHTMPMRESEASPMNFFFLVWFHI
ncbi:hypothetical protein K491DRAFT_685527 [Lophiostoma macrostomum CBS 122681]|uniref:Uncharacterized protein n=1 Tax=Lophiostoma macrostomum CBS 122681 TaxID=1314788 RepID=A0A6A6SLB3_9PLEO|nr:hypothetical protein K491DRAFT_685527 [Lophiostoma macrostomum CBS 122681]